MQQRSKSGLDAELLDRILSQLNSGEADLETLLARSELAEGQADELRTLVRVAALVQEAPQPVASPEAREAGRRQLLRAVMEKRRERAVPAPSFRDYVERLGGALQALWRPRAPLRRATVLVTALVIVVALSSLGVTRAAAGSLPDSPLYPIKLATEQVQLALTPSPEGKARLHIAFGERRLQEALALAEKGRGVNEGVLAAMLDHNKRALGAIARLPQQERVPLLADFASLAEKEWMTLQQVKQRVPSSDQAAVDEAIAASAQNQALAEAAQKNPDLLPTPSPTPTLTAVKLTPTDTAVKPTAKPVKPSPTAVEPTAKPTSVPTRGPVVGEQPIPIEPSVTPTAKPTATPTMEKKPTAVPTETPMATPTPTYQVVVPPPPTEIPPSPTPEPTPRPTEPPTLTPPVWEQPPPTPSPVQNR